MVKSDSVSFRVLALAAGFVSFGGAAQAQFLDWPSALKPGSTVVVGGVAQELTYETGPSGAIRIDPPATDLFVAYSQNLDANGAVTALSMQHANRTIGFYKSNGDTIDPVSGGRLIYARASDWTRQALLADPTALGWTFQSFGVWQSGVGLAAGSMGAASVGAITPGTSVPQTGAATFNGLMAGLYNDVSGLGYAVAADMTLNVNFAAHNASFATTNTTDRDGRLRRELDITGTFVSLPNHPALFGALNTTTLTGTSSAQFYGPAAEEVGGVFTMTPKSGQSLERLAGAFGGARSDRFTSWASALRPNATPTVSGQSQEMAYTFQGPATDFRVVYATPTAAAAATFSQTLDSSGAIFDLQIATPGRTIGFTRLSQDYIGEYTDPRILMAFRGDNSRWLLAADPTRAGWNYQSFGIWQTRPPPGGGSFGALSVGAATTGAAVPTTGAATFHGLVLATYSLPDALIGFGMADMTLTTDFAARRATFASTALVYADGVTRAAGTELSGVLTYAASQNQLSGTLTTGSGRLSGLATGRFYGPTAQEVGGTFILTPADPTASVERLTGAFGGRR